MDVRKVHDKNVKKSNGKRSGRGNDGKEKKRTEGKEMQVRGNKAHSKGYRSGSKDSKRKERERKE